MYGQLGLGHSEHQHKPVLVLKDEQIEAISCGWSHTLIYKKTTELFIFGDNSVGQFGLGHTMNQNKPVLVMKDEPISILMSQRIDLSWSPQSHLHFPKPFQEAILALMLCSKRLNVKVPKFVIFEIIKYVGYYSFHKHLPSKTKETRDCILN